MWLDPLVYNALVFSRTKNLFSKLQIKISNLEVYCCTILIMNIKKDILVGVGLPCTIVIATTEKSIQVLICNSVRCDPCSHLPIQSFSINFNWLNSLSISILWISHLQCSIISYSGWSFYLRIIGVDQQYISRITFYLYLTYALP